MSPECSGNVDDEIAQTISSRKFRFMYVSDCTRRTHSLVHYSRRDLKPGPASKSRPHNACLAHPSLLLRP